MPATQITAYCAPCPTCSSDAQWQATASNNGDLTRTIVTYDIDCAGCGEDADDATNGALRTSSGEVSNAARDEYDLQRAMSKMTFLRRTA